jgi:hypothetical protein
VSWLRLERYRLGEIQGDERAQIAAHLASCSACAACLAHIEDDDAGALPPLSVPGPVRRKSVISLLPVRAAGIVGALAAAAVLVLVLRGGKRPGELPHTGGGGSRIKGDAIAFSLVRDDDERIAGTSGVYRQGDRFKAIVTCPPGAGISFDVAVVDVDGLSFPLEPANALACGNEVPIPGAFRLTGDTEETVCLVWSEGAPVDRAELASRGAPEGRSQCKRLTPAPKR